MAKGWKPVTEKYFGTKIGDTQNCDEPYDPAFNHRFSDQGIMNGRGSQGGGSARIPQRSLQARGYSHNKGSAPASKQKIRG